MRDVSLSYISILRNPGPFTDPEYESEIAIQELHDAKILVIGAGGLGCELLRDLAMTGIKDMSVIDMDTIELTNLNRQFLFRREHVGKSKAITAANAVMERIQGVEIVPYFAKIEDFDDDFYMQFTMVICGLDSIEARRWINSKLVHLSNDLGKIIPMIDGGTEGFQGSVKLIIPSVSACFECYRALIPDRVVYPLCTLAAMPRLPEHCIEWAHQLEWNKRYPGVVFDADDMKHVDQMYELALGRANEFGIEGVTKSSTLGVVKNIIPAIASTNAIISAQCCNEAFKFLTSCNPNMRDSAFYNGENGVLFESDDFLPLPDCPVCQVKLAHVVLERGGATTLRQLGELVQEQFSLVSPVIMRESGSEVYNYKRRSENDVDETIETVALRYGTVLTVVDSTIETALRLRIDYMANSE